MPRITIPQLMLFREHWKDYHFRLPEEYGGRSKKARASAISLWHLHGSDIHDAYLSMMSVIMEPPAYASLCTLARLMSVKRQRYLENTGAFNSVPSNILSQLSDEQVDKFIDLVHGRLMRILHPRFEPQFIHRLLWELGLFVYNGDRDALSCEEIATLALSGIITVGICGSRKTIRKEWGGAYVQRVRHPMIRFTFRQLTKRIYHYFTGGRIFLWLSNIVYWRYWRHWRRAHHYQGT